ncbi:phospholipid scramblase 3-like [Mya arenaria]|uniref:phospholipid scramblase 3-like n=1 Tax=Mya arenaria TaxID=6604 RepID=UPI0022E4095A|nr:phospholipid scramblase 3-like [Mya arenaria]
MKGSSDTYRDNSNQATHASTSNKTTGKERENSEILQQNSIARVQEKDPAKSNLQRIVSVFKVVERYKQEKRHDASCLRGGSFIEKPRGRHNPSLLWGSLLRKQSRTGYASEILARPRGSLRSPSKGALAKVLVQRSKSYGDIIRHNLNSRIRVSTMEPQQQADIIVVTQPTATKLSIGRSTGNGAVKSIPPIATSAGNANGSASVKATPSATSAAITTTVKPKPKLERRKSLNPRVMTPPGLEVLNNSGMLAVRQQIEMDIHGGCGAPNTYKIWDINDEQVFFATEESGCLCRWTCGPARRFSLDVYSTQDDQVLNFHRTGCRCDCCCCLDCFICLQKLYVVDCLGRTLGAVKQKFSIFNAKFDIVDHDNNVLFKVLGSFCPCRCATEIYFQVFNKTGERQIGRIQKKWGGDRGDNVNVDHEYFDVTFPPKLDSVDKALILGAAFLVNVMYMEMS